MDRVLLILCALLLNIVFAGPRGLYAHAPFTSIARLPAQLLRWVERKLNRDHRGLEQRHMRGVILVTAMIILGLLTGWVGEILFFNNLRFVEIIVLAILLPTRQTWDFASALGKALQAGNTQKARKLFAGTAWQHYMLLDTHGLARAGIETLAVHFSEKILAPIFWYLLCGLPGFVISKTMTLMVETLTPLNNEALAKQGFSGGPIAVYQLLHYIPSRMAALLWPIAGLIPPHANPLKVSAAIFATPFIAASPQELSLLAAASCLNLSLGGPTSIHTGSRWEGKGTVKATVANLTRARYLFAALHLLLFIALSVLL